MSQRDRTSGPGGHRKSSKLERTLAELESAFTDWESLSDSGVREGKPVKAREMKDSGARKTDPSLQKKTKRLLVQLRKQLADLDR